MDNIPQHVVIVPDGNRRWERQKRLATNRGHFEGAVALEKAIKAAYDFKIRYLTVWGSSTSNIDKRSKAEVATLFEIYESYFKKLANQKEIHENKVKIRVLGRWEERFPDKVKEAINNAINTTARYDQYHLTILLYYTGLDEMLSAVKSICKSKAQNSSLEINEDTIKSHLLTCDLPAVDLVIRTGGEPHWSAGFLMWDVAEAQLYFTQTLWPDFSKQEFAKALDYYSKTERRHGK